MPILIQMNLFFLIKVLFLNRQIEVPSQLIILILYTHHISLKWQLKQLKQTKKLSSLNLKFKRSCCEHSPSPMNSHCRCMYLDSEIHHCYSARPPPVTGHHQSCLFMSLRHFLILRYMLGVWLVIATLMLTCSGVCVLLPLFALVFHLFSVDVNMSHRVSFPKNNGAAEPSAALFFLLLTHLKLHTLTNPNK